MSELTNYKKKPYRSFSKYKRNALEKHLSSGGKLYWWDKYDGTWVLCKPNMIFFELEKIYSDKPTPLEVFNSEKKSFSELEKAEKEAILEYWSDKEEIWKYDLNTNMWGLSGHLKLDGVYSNVYPLRHRKNIEISWEALKISILWVAMNADGSWSGFEVRPFLSKYKWVAAIGAEYNLSCLEIDNNGVHWEQSLFQRP